MISLVDSYKIILAGKVGEKNRSEHEVQQIGKADDMNTPDAGDFSGVLLQGENLFRPL